MRYFLQGENQGENQGADFSLRKERQEKHGSESTEIPREASPEHVNCAVISEGQQEEQRKQDGKRSASLYTENIIENDNNRDDCIYCAQETVHICACDMISEGQQQIMMGERMRGGAGGVGLTDLAVRLATRLGFCITAGTPNPAVGNCLIESAVFNINDRPELSELGAIEDTIQECRDLWVTQFKTKIPIFRPELDAFTDEQWAEIRRDGVWNTPLGDLMPFCISFATKKRILILNCSSELRVPLSIVEPEEFGQDHDCDIPILLAYNGNHYESVHPVSKDIQKTIELFDKTKLDNDCSFLTSTDIQSLLEPLTGAEKMKRSRFLKNLGVAPSPKKTMTPDEKRQKETSRKQLYRQTNPDKYTLEKQKIAEQQAQARQSNPNRYTLEKRKIAISQKERKRKRIYI